MGSRFDEMKDAGNKAVAVKNYDLALKHYRDAFKLDASSQVLHANMSLCYRQTKKYELAEYHALEAIRIAPTWARGYQRMGELAETFGLYGRASFLLERAISTAAAHGDAKGAEELNVQRLRVQAAYEKEMEGLLSLVTPQAKVTSLCDSNSDGVRMLYARSWRFTAAEQATRESLLTRLRSVDPGHTRELLRPEPEDLVLQADDKSLRAVLDQLQGQGQAYGKETSCCVVVPSIMKADVLSHPVLLHTLLTTSKLRVHA